MKRRSVLFAATACLLVSCNGDEDGAQSTLNVNRAKWAASGIESYVFERSFLSSSFSEEAIVVTVTEGALTSAFFTPSGVLVEPERRAQLRTIDEFFDFVQDLIDENVYQLDVTYSTAYGFPADIHIDYGELTIDDEVSFFIRNFQ